MPDWLLEVAGWVAIAALLSAALTWLFPSKRERSMPPRARAGQAAATVAIVLSLMMGAEHVWPASRAAPLLAALAAVLLLATARGVGERRARSG